MEKKRRNKNIILGAVIVLVAVAMAALPMLLSSRQGTKDDAASILSATVERGDIRSTISGGGALTEEEGVAVSVPHGVEVREYLVRNGDLVTEGQPLAEVDKNSVMTTIATVQKNLEYLEKQLRRSAVGDGTAVLTSPAAGRVKAVYGEKGDRVEDIMAEHGMLCLVSLDGLMALQLETETALEAGDTVTVTLSDGTAVNGRVERRQGNILTVTLSDDGPALGDTARVTAPDGTELGEGELYVHSAWHLTAATGTVGNISARVEKPVTIGTRLFYLENVAGAGETERLAAQHREYEDAMLRLFELYGGGTINAPAEGRAKGIDTAKVGLMRARPGEFRVVFLNDPGDPPDPTYVNKPAMVTETRFDQITFLVQDNPVTIDSYTTPPALDAAAASPEVRTDFDGKTVFGYDKDSGSWSVIGPGGLEEGDMVYMVYDPGGALIWVVRPVKQAAPEIPGFSWGGGGGGGVEQPFEMYDLTETDLLEVVPQNTMTVEVTIDELDILSVAEGQEAEITVDALPGRAYTGTVSRIDPNGQNQGGHTKYNVTIAIDRDDNMIAGMNATAILTVGVTENILTLPAAALAEKGSRTLVYMAWDAESETLLDPIEVVTGVSDGTTVEILSGVEEGTTVWYRYYEASGVPDFSLAGPVMTA